MKKTVLLFCGIFLLTATLISCGSTKKGCGLTSDANKIEQSTSNEYIAIEVTK